MPGSGMLPNSVEVKCFMQSEKCGKETTPHDVRKKGELNSQIVIRDKLMPK